MEALKSNEGFSVLPESICEKALKTDVIQMPFPAFKSVKQQLFCSCKVKNERLKEVKHFKEKMNY